MDLEIYDKTKDGVPAKHVDMIKEVLEYAGKYLELAENTEMSVTLMNNEDIHRINKQYRGVDRATDVISFAIEDDEEEDTDFPLVMDPEMAAEIPENIGDIFVSMDKVAEQAEYLGHSYERELGFLVVHGFLHLNGYDHMKPEDEKVMFKLQADILDAYGLKR
ncbi:rRNA maturation RNase YbeY [Levilactobacillus sp. N40-8-2]|uniref:rRNA maturation RNase YbeY n=1 Tax=Levilactobacillus muriae TaxID=3238987 RepID=UPI0038B35CDE